MAKSILVPLDGSHCAERAIPVAIIVARRTGSELHVVRAHEQAGMNLPTALPGADQVWHHQQESLMRFTASRLERECGITTRWELLQGRPAPAIESYVRLHDIDLVIMTTHGRSGLARAWLGSTAEALLRLSSVPILLIRPETAVKLDGFERMLVALDGAPTAERGLDAALAMVSDEHCVLLRVVMPPAALRSLVMPGAAEWERAELERRCVEADLYLAELAKRTRSLARTVEVRRVVSGNVAKTVLREARNGNVDLLVLGTHGRHPLLRAMLGSVADKVIRSAGVPVLVSPTSTR
jgi:nucleotide-binding universal stress UspA family protein